MEPDLENEQHDISFQEWDQVQIEKVLLDLNEPQPNTDESMNNTDFMDTFTESIPNQFTATLQDFEEFEKTMLVPYDANFFSQETIVSTEHQATDILQDFEMFENSILPVNQIQSGIEDNDLMVEEMADGTLEFMIGNYPPPTQTMDLTSGFLGVNNVGGNVITMGSYMQYRRVFNYGSGSMSTRRVHYIKCSNVKQDLGLTNQGHVRKRRKKKHKGVIETAEQTAERLELTRIKNRVAANRAHEKRKIRQARLEAQIPQLRKKNRYLRNSIMFLEGQKRMDLPQNPLKRTISDSQLNLLSPIQIRP